MTESECVIEQLLQRPFRLNSLNEKLEIVQSGRPCPELRNLKAAHKDKVKNTFDISTRLNIAGQNGSQGVRN